MIRVAICDDDSSVLVRITELISQYNNSKDILTDKYPSAIKFLEAVKAGNYYDIIFMDICMEELTGIDAGIMLRQDLQSEASLLIFVSSHSNLAVHVFDTRPFNFIVKPITEAKFAKVFIQALNTVQGSLRIFEYHKGKGEINRCSYKEIRYFTSSGREILIGKIKSEDRFYGKLGEVEQLLAEQRCNNFVRINRCNIVNVDYITKFTPLAVKIGDQIMINYGKTYIEKAYKKITDYREMRKCGKGNYE